MKTEKELLDIAEKIAKETIFDGANYEGIIWKGLHVFTPYRKQENNKISCVGLPQFILLDDDGIERKKDITEEETFEIFGLLPYDEDDEPDEED